MVMSSVKEGLSFIKKWGPVGFCTHYAVSFTALGLIYYAVYSNREQLLSYLPSYVPQQGTDFVVALAIHKLSLPVRVPLTLALVPIVHRTLAKTGVLKAVEKIVSKSSATSAAVVADEMNAADSTADKKTD
ncbi:unnamed protein product [Amoebophrya sp. A120]|nr:unnamed protein product [Amoebophrya sp. A120]|eukprot:GSA120T00021353001.1